MVKNIFVVGLDSLNKAALERLPRAKDYRFHQLLTREELIADPISIPRLITKADLVLRDFKGKIDASTVTGTSPGQCLYPCCVSATACARHLCAPLLPVST